jgi:long-chain acyl-CoA synthetase
MEWKATDPPASRREAHYGNRIVSCFVARPASVPAMLAATVRANPTSEAIVCNERRWTWRDVEAETIAMAVSLAKLGVVPGDRVALLLGNQPEFVLAFYAILRLGAVAVPLSMRHQTTEIAFALQDCGAVALIHDATIASRIPSQKEVPQLRLRIVVGAANASIPDQIFGGDSVVSAVEPAMSAQTDEEETAVILYTSGTTGRPKGAMLTHLSLINSALVYKHCFALSSGDRSIAAVPLSHVTGLVGNILAMAICGGCLIILPDFKAAAFLALAEAERMTHTIIVPAMYNLCLMSPDFGSRDLSAWRIGGFGGAPMPEPTIQKLAEKIPGLKLMNAYGATETSSPSTIMPASETMSRLASVGLPAPNCEILVVDDKGVELGAGETGEIWISGPSIVKGYWRRPDADAESFTAGYWRSGDVGMKDEDGFVYILDRKKDMINRGGYKIFSAEVESALASHPRIVESAVVARSCPVLGERVHAFVTVRQPAPTPAELQAYLARTLSDYKVPETFTLSSEPQPRNANGKILKRLLRDSLPRS